MLTESGVVQNPCAQWQVFLFVLSDSLFENTFCFFISDLFPQIFGCCSLSSFSFFCLLFFLFFFACYLSGSSVLPAVDHLQGMLRVPWTMWSLYHHLQRGLSVLLCPDLCNMFISDLEEVNSSSLTGRHLSIYSRAELPETYIEAGWWNELTGALWKEDLTDSRQRGQKSPRLYEHEWRQ